jgi:predicted metal-dependent hydrolase
MTDRAAATTVVQGGRAKAYRPLPAADREAAFIAGVAAYERGDFFAAHEHLEPAWMGTADAAERDLHQGLIKLAAAYVHAVRGNPTGMAKNLRGARTRLASALDARADERGLDLPALIADVDVRLERLGREPDRVVLDPPPLRGRPR